MSHDGGESVDLDALLQAEQARVQERKRLAANRERARVLAEGRFRPIADDLWRELVAELVAIDLDLERRGFFSSNLRSNSHRSRFVQHLRALFTSRVRTFIDAHRLAQVIPCKDEWLAIHTGLGQMFRRERDRFMAKYDREREITGKDTYFGASFRNAVDRDARAELERAGQLLRTDLAELELTLDGARLGQAPRTRLVQPILAGSPTRSADASERRFADGEAQHPTTPPGEPGASGASAPLPQEKRASPRKRPGRNPVDTSLDKQVAQLMEEGRLRGKRQIAKAIGAPEAIVKASMARIRSRRAYSRRANKDGQAKT